MTDSMTIEVVTTVLAGAAVLIGCLGVVLPVLPGSITIAVAVLVWAFVIGGTTGWVTFAVVAVLVAVGMAASWVLTGKRLKDRQIPNRSLLVGGVLAIVGFFFIPVVGLLVGFVAGLYLAEYLRLKDSKVAWESSWAAIKAAGIGIVVEFSCAAVAATVFLVGVLIHFVF